MCLGLSGIAVGLGAWMPDLRESSAAKIAAGFGGTLALVLGALVVVVVVLATAVPTQLTILARHGHLVGGGWMRLLSWLGTWPGVAAGVAAAVAVSAAAAVVPMALGFEAFRRLEP
jgi:ABC-2 type transport system permease protein